MSVAFIVTGLLIPLADDVLFAPLVGTVVIISVYYGLGPALVATAVGWVAVLLVYVEPRWRLPPDTLSDAISWGVGLAVALVLIWASWTLQRLRDQATRRATEAEETSAVSRELHEIAAALASAATPSEVAGALLARVPSLLGSVGGSLGLVEGDDLVIVDPEGPTPALEPGLRLPLTTRAPITVAARTGAPAHAGTRDEFVREFPDGARLAPYAQSALAVPAQRRWSRRRLDRVPVHAGERDRREHPLARADRRRARRSGARALARIRAGARREGRARADHAARAALRRCAGGGARGGDLHRGP